LKVGTQLDEPHFGWDVQSLQRGYINIPGYAKSVLRLEAAQCSFYVCRVVKKPDTIGLAARGFTGDRKPLAQAWHANRIIIGLNICPRYGLPSAVGHDALIAHYGIFQGLNDDLTAKRRGARAQILDLVATLVVVRGCKPRQEFPPTVEGDLCTCGRR